MKDLTLILLTIFSFWVKAQVDTNYQKVRVLEIDDLWLHSTAEDSISEDLAVIDTNVHGISDPWDQFTSDRIYIHANNGAFIPLSYEKNRWLGNMPFQFEDLYLPNNIYRTKTPFTRIEGMTGGNSQERLDFLHTQNVMYNWNLGLRHRFSRDESSYSFATTRKWITQLYSYYESRNKRYSNHIDVQFSQGRNRENFGVDSVALLSDVIPSADLLSVNNQAAVHENRRMSLSMRHKYVVTQPDSLSGLDSLNSHFYLFQDIDYTWQSHVFEDENNSFNYDLYPNFLGDSSQIFDSIYVRQFELPIGVGFRTKNLNNEFFIKQYFFKYYSHDSVFNSVQRPYFQTSVNNRLLIKLGNSELRSTGELTIAGINRGTYQITNQLKVSDRIEIGLNYHSLTPQPFWENYNNAYLNWNTSFIPENELNASMSYHKSGFTWYNEIKNIDNRIYFDGSSVTQTNRSLQVLKSSINYGWSNHSWGFKTRNSIQHSTDSLVSIPTFLSKAWIYKKGALFNNKMLIEIGIDVSYNTDFYAPFYNPFMGILVPQQEIIVKGYPLVGAYLSGKVKRARFYFKGDHLNQGLTGFDYYSTFGFPINGRNFKFGIVFDLFN